MADFPESHHERPRRRSDRVHISHCDPAKRRTFGPIDVATKQVMYGDYDFFEEDSQGNDFTLEKIK